MGLPGDLHRIAADEQRQQRHDAVEHDPDEREDARRRVADEFAERRQLPAEELRSPVSDRPRPPRLEHEAHRRAGERRDAARGADQICDCGSVVAAKAAAPTAAPTKNSTSIRTAP